MSEQLCVELKISYVDEWGQQELEHEIKKVVENNNQEFEKITQGHSSLTDIRAEYIADSLEVDEIQFSTSIYDENDMIIDELLGFMRVSFGYTAFQGCKDLDSGGWLEDTWHFHMVDRMLVFRLDIPEQRYDEI